MLARPGAIMNAPLSETIVNQRPDFPVAVLRAWFSAAVRKVHPVSAAQEHVAVAALPDDHFGGNRRSLERVPPKPPNSRAHGCQHHHLCPPRLWQTSLRAVVRASIWLSFRCEPVQSGPPAHHGNLAAGSLAGRRSLL